MIKTNIMYYTFWYDDDNNNNESDEKWYFDKMNEHCHYTEITLCVYGQRRAHNSKWQHNIIDIVSNKWTF